MDSTSEVCQLYPNINISYALYNNVQNCEELKEKSKKEEIKVALINPKMVMDKLQFLAAANKAVHLDQNDKKITKNIHSEVIFQMSGTRSFADAFQKYGISAQAGSPVLAVEVAENGQSKMGEIQSLIIGDQVIIDQLSSMCDHQTIKQSYKIKDPELQIGTLLEAVVGRIATKDFVKYK